MKKLAIILTVILVALLAAATALTLRPPHQPDVSREISAETAAPTQPEPVTTPEETDPQTAPSLSETQATEPSFRAIRTQDTHPANWNTQWQIMTDGAPVKHYSREDPIFFNKDDTFALPGIYTFRGNHFRQGASYGTATVTEKAITQLSAINIGFLDSPEWGGCGWTGQPLVVQWDAETKAIMNLYPEKKEKEDLVEVIYAKMDGYVHFLDIEDGSYTRDPLFVGMAFKGSGSLDPRGYPILYLGAGLTRNGINQSIYAISLIDGSILYKRSGYEEFTRRYWFGFDSAPLVDGDTDTLIWAGESGILYTIKLNTHYSKEAGILTMAPEEPVMTYYRNDYTDAGRYAGYEASIAAAENYLFLGDNAGMLQCVDVNTMDLVWAQDITDDINATPLFEWGEDGNAYLYAAPSMDYSGFSGEMSVYKLDARTGKILWTYPFECMTDEEAPGGFLASPLLGRQDTDLEDLIIFSVGRSPYPYSGQVVAFNKLTGQVVWQVETANYIWSSPVAIYTEEGKGYVFQADASGNCYLLDGATGTELDMLKLKCTVESSPVVFGNRIVLGSRPRIYLLEIT